MTRPLSRLILIQRPPIIEESTVMITLNGHVFVMPHSLAGLPFYPALAVAVLGVLYVLAGRNRVLTFERPVNVSGMRDIAAGHDLIEPVKPLRALPPAILPSARRRRRFNLLLLQFGDPRV